MSEEAIMLAKPYNAEKLLFPVMVNEKIDGVACDFYRTDSGEYRARSRYGEPIYSVPHLLAQLEEENHLQPGDHLICELSIPGKPFKDISGAVRRKEPCKDLIAFIYDFYNESKMDVTYHERYIKRTFPAGLFRLPWGICSNTRHGLEQTVEHFLRDHPKSEGLVIRHMHGKHSHYKPGRRSWGMMKLKRQATVDIELIKVERAIDIEGNPKDMVGRLICKFKGRTVGIGPGKLTHAERTDIWKNPWNYIGKIVEVAYMPDQSYSALREGRFLRWRPEKTQPSYA